MMGQLIIVTLASLLISQAHSQAVSCSTNICLNNGICLIIEGAASCACRPGFSGKVCESQTNEGNPCKSLPCENGGICIASSNSFVCVCANEYTGRLCQSPKDATTTTTTTTTAAPANQNPCDVDPCLNMGICLTEGQFGYKCICPGTHSGDFCQIPIDLVTTTSAPSSCVSGGNIGCDPAELVFLLEYGYTDSRNSIDHEGDYIKELIDEWRIDERNIRVGLVIYHDTVREVVHIGNYTNADAVKNYITSLTRQLGPSGTPDLAKALDYVRQTSFQGSRPGVEKLVWPIVHQMSSATSGNIQPAAQKLKDACITVLATGVGLSSSDAGIISGAVTQPSPTHYFAHRTFTEMEYAAKFYNKIC